MAGAQTTIGGFLARCRGVIYRTQAVRAALLGIAALAGVALALPLAGYLAVESAQTTFALLCVGGLLGLLVLASAILFGIVAPRRRYRGDRAVARWVGLRHRTIASDLLSSVELDASENRPAAAKEVPLGGAPSPALVSALRSQIAAKLETIDPRSLLSPRALRRARVLALVAIAANVVVTAAAPGAIAFGWKRLSTWPAQPFDGAELSMVPVVGDLHATLIAPAYTKRAPISLASTTGDLRGLPGTLVRLRAHILVPASRAELLVEADSRQPPRSVVASIDETGRLIAELTMEHSARYRFAITSPNGTRTVEALSRAIDLEVDQPPIVQLTTPGEPLDVSNVKRIELGYAVEDDFAVTAVELVWEAGPRSGAGVVSIGGRGGIDRGKKPLSLAVRSPADAGGTGNRTSDEALPRVQGKLTWDIAEVGAPTGGEVRYWIEAKDNDLVGGPKTGRSQEFHLRIASPRARHEATLNRQQEIATKLLSNLGNRLVGPGDDTAARKLLSRDLVDALTELRSVGAAYERDPHASDPMRKALLAMSERIGRLGSVEQRLIQGTATKDPAHLPSKVGKSKSNVFTTSDTRIIAELEDDTLVLADWLDRERVESLLDLSDEVAAHQRRLADLLAQHMRTKAPRLLSEIERELGALNRTYAELTKRRSAMPEDVLDQYIHRDAAKPEDGASCMSEVSALVRSGQSAAAQTKLTGCQQLQLRSAAALESSLARVRADKFSDEQNKLDEVMNELSDVAKDQHDIAADSARVFDSYARKAKEIAREHRRDVAKTVGNLVDKLKKRIGAIDETGLTPLALDELDVVLRRFADVEHMIDNGDLAEALEMAQQASRSLDVIADELSSVLSDDPKSKWVDATKEALEGVHKTRSLAKELLQELQVLAPRPAEIMSDDDRRTLERLRRSQAATQQRAKRLEDRIKQLGTDLPGDTSLDLGKKLLPATEHMAKAVDRMREKDPAGARASSRAAADELAKARDRARSSARQAQISAVQDEPIRIPGADEYKTSARFREELLDAMKRKGTRGLEGYELMLKRYYQDLAK